MEDKIRVLLTEEEVNEKIKKIGEQVSKDYAGKSVHMICVLKGGVFFTCELAKRITVPVSLDFMSVSSYGSETKSSGIVKIIKDLDEPLEGKDVLIVEDIIDSGRTLSYLIEILKKRNPASIRLCTLLDKPERRVTDVKVDYVAFNIPDEFVVGYGLDYAQKYRNLPFIGVVEQEKGEPELKNVLKGSIFYVIIAIIVVLGINYIRGNLVENTGVTYSQFQKYVAQNKVSGVEVRQNSQGVTGELTVHLKDGEYRTLDVSDVTKAEDLLEQKNISYKVTVEKESVFMTTVLPMLLICVIFMVFFTMGSRQATGGNARMMNFGKSRATLTMPDNSKVTFKDVAGLQEENEDLQ